MIRMLLKPILSKKNIKMFYLHNKLIFMLLKFIAELFSLAFRLLNVDTYSLASGAGQVMFVSFSGNLDGDNFCGHSIVSVDFFH